MTTIWSPRNSLPSRRLPRSRAAAAIKLRPSLSSRESTHFKWFPKLAVAQFDFGAQSDVAGQQAHEGRCGHGIQGGEKIQDAFARTRRASRQDIVQEKNVVLKESLHVFPGHGNSMIIEKFTDKTGIRASGELQFLESVPCVEFGRENSAERFGSSATSAHERAVNVK
jgi:hypothetical protein